MALFNKWLPRSQYRLFAGNTKYINHGGGQAMLLLDHQDEVRDEHCVH